MAGFLDYLNALGGLEPAQPSPDWQGPPAPPPFALVAPWPRDWQGPPAPSRFASEPFYWPFDWQGPPAPSRSPAPPPPRSTELPWTTTSGVAASAELPRAQLSPPPDWQGPPAPLASMADPETLAFARGLPMSMEVQSTMPEGATTAPAPPAPPAPPTPSAAGRYVMRPGAVFDPETRTAIPVGPSPARPFIAGKGFGGYVRPEERRVKPPETALDRYLPAELGTPVRSGLEMTASMDGDPAAILALVAGAYGIRPEDHVNSAQLFGQLRGQTLRQQSFEQNLNERQRQSRINQGFSERAFQRGVFEADRGFERQKFVVDRAFDEAKRRADNDYDAEIAKAEASMANAKAKSGQTRVSDAIKALDGARQVRKDALDVRQQILEVDTQLRDFEELQRGTGLFETGVISARFDPFLNMAYSERRAWRRKFDQWRTKQVNLLKTDSAIADQERQALLATIENIDIEQGDLSRIFEGLTATARRRKEALMGSLNSLAEMESQYRSFAGLDPTPRASDPQAAASGAQRTYEETQGMRQKVGRILNMSPEEASRQAAAQDGVLAARADPALAGAAAPQSPQQPSEAQMRAEVERQAAAAQVGLSEIANRYMRTGNGPVRMNDYVRLARYAPVIEEAARRHGVPAAALATIAFKESNFDPNDRGDLLPDGTRAKGMFQFIDSTAARYGIDPDDPAQAADATARMLKSALTAFGGDVPLAAAAHMSGLTGMIERMQRFGDPFHNSPKSRKYYEDFKRLYPRFGGSLER